MRLRRLLALAGAILVAAPAAALGASTVSVSGGVLTFTSGSVPGTPSGVSIQPAASGALSLRDDVQGFTLGPGCVADPNVSVGVICAPRRSPRSR